MEISSRVTRTALTRAGLDRVYSVLADVPLSVAHFPEIDSLVEEDGVWVWRLRKLGAGPIMFQVHYGSRYAFDPVTRVVTWTAVPTIGNTRVDGRWTMAPEGAGTRFTMETTFAVDTPFPRPMRAAVEAIVRRENERILGVYLDNLVRTLDGGDGRVRRG